MIVIDDFNKRFDFVSSGLFLFSHSFRYFSRITSDTSDQGVTVTSFVASVIVRLKKKTKTPYRNEIFDDKREKNVVTLTMIAFRPA